MTRSIRRITIGCLIAIAALAVGSLDSHVSSAKGNVYVLTGGDLGDYAYTWVGIDIPGEGARAVPAPPDLPTLSYDLYHSWGNLAVPYQMARGSAAHEYFPTSRLMVGRDVTKPSPIDYWYELSPSTADSLDTLIEEAIAARSAGTLDRGAISADLHARRMAEADYSFAPYSPTGPPPFQIGLEARDQFVMSALVDTLARPIALPADMQPTYRISYQGTFANGGGIGGLLGYYSPPRERDPGIFWDDGYPSALGQPYETTAEFDELVAEAQSEGHANVALDGTAGSEPPISRRGWIAVASSIALGLVGLSFGIRMVRTSGRGARVPR